ncbi:ABC transporter ATP-binding protein [Vibrio sp. Of7-15]|uniref:ABC transporter ATP-binding protein n=1 Tax=Vibrio sp. Of7-15 TaxID=2724879 RepID=UPI001EF2651D|nr:ABC transporter ATP-binding protein [Vibrio sp. Of7-15]MCG7495632.1 ABC transporter ATP-binding protein [Vibrio sp. Of7-15]
MIRFENIYKSYKLGETETVALHGASASISKGETVALVGPSGSGKSTLLNICGLLDNNYQGVLEIDGEKVSRDEHTITTLRREKLGFIFQHYNLIPVMTALENVEYPLMLSPLSKAERKNRALSVLESVGLKEQANKRPDQLSGGQQQRVAIARALVKNPLLVIADEPTANLDTETASLVIDLMKNLGRQSNTTFLVATHDERMTSRCDRVIRLQDGLINQDLVQACSNKVTHETIAEGV